MFLSCRFSRRWRPLPINVSSEDDLGPTGGDANSLLMHRCEGRWESMNHLGAPVILLELPAQDC
jgi:hypothetical protein